MKLTPNEELLVELVHYVAYGTEREMGLTLKETKLFLTRPIKAKSDYNALECLNSDGRAFINELKTFINASES